ncbi:MAG: hypothetical protein RML37_10735, partial [Chitinophagales bacterium]|nr:hypothetical protein [Chitinophagales bacterium]
YQGRPPVAGDPGADLNLCDIPCMRAGAADAGVQRKIVTRKNSGKMIFRSITLFQSGEGCGGRERSEAAAPAPLKNKQSAGAAGATAYPVASPTPLRREAARSEAAGAPHNNIKSCN